MSDGELHEFLTMRPKSDILRWWAALNRWEWPDDLPGKPDGWDDMRHSAKRKAGGQVWAALHTHTTESDRHRYWQTHMVKWSR